MPYGIVHRFAGGTEDQYRASIAAVVNDHEKSPLSIMEIPHPQRRLGRRADARSRVGLAVLSSRLP
jgi:hypothetical protein